MVWGKNGLASAGLFFVMKDIRNISRLIILPEITSIIFFNYFLIIYTTIIFNITSLYVAVTVNWKTSKNQISPPPYRTNCRIHFRTMFSTNQIWWQSTIHLWEPWCWSMPITPVMLLPSITMETWFPRRLYIKIPLIAITKGPPLADPS